jgi:hypothetical protein
MTRPVVRHLTRVMVRPGEIGLEQAAAILEVLTRSGFQVAPDGAHVVAASGQVEAFEVKALLRLHGVRDDAYQVVLEYERAWGMM